VRLVKERKVGCAYVAVKRGRKYSHLEVDLIDCRAQDLETLDLVREIIWLLYDRVILRSEAWARALREPPIHVIRELLESIASGYAYFFKGPRIWVSASRSRASIVAESHVVREAVAEVERLLEERLQAPRAHAKNPRGGSHGGPQG
jgi:hypothetical protein